MVKQKKNNGGFSLKARFTVEVELFGPGERGDWSEKVMTRYHGVDLSITFPEIIESLAAELQHNSRYQTKVSPPTVKKRGKMNGFTFRRADRRFRYLLDNLGEELNAVADAMTDEGIFLDIYQIHLDFASDARSKYIKETVKEYEGRLRKRLPNAAHRPKDKDKLTFPEEKTAFVAKCWNLLQQMSNEGSKLSLSGFASLMYPPVSPIRNPEKFLDQRFRHFGFSWSQLKASFEGKLERGITTLEEEEKFIARILALDAP